MRGGLRIELRGRGGGRRGERGRKREKKERAIHSGRGHAKTCLHNIFIKNIR